MNKINYIIMLVLGIFIIIFPNSLLTILIFGIGGYLFFLGFNFLISSIKLIKYEKGWRYDGIKSIILLILGLVLIFNSGKVAVSLSGLLFIIIGLIVLSIGVFAVIKSKNDYPTGSIFIIVGLLIIIFPLGISFFITRIIGLFLVGISINFLKSF